MLRERGKCVPPTGRGWTRVSYAATEFSRLDAGEPWTEPNPIRKSWKNKRFLETIWFVLRVLFVLKKNTDPAARSRRKRAPRASENLSWRAVHVDMSVEKTNNACATPDFFFYVSQICSNLNQCFCDNHWTGIDCSIQLEISPTSPSSAEATLSPEDAKKAKNDLESKMIMKETPYGKTVARACYHIVII